jgi:hypothetical protein
VQLVDLVVEFQEMNLSRTSWWIRNNKVHRKLRNLWKCSGTGCQTGNTFRGKIWRWRWWRCWSSRFCWRFYQIVVDGAASVQQVPWSRIRRKLLIMEP